MAYDYMDLRPGKKILLDNEPFEVVTADFLRKQQRKAVVKATIRNLSTGRVIPKTFQGSDEIGELSLDAQHCQFLYRSGDDFTFMDMTTYDQFVLPKDQVGDAANYLADGTEVDLTFFRGKPISLIVPKKVDLLVTDAPPGVRGDTANSATKAATLETGYVVQVPLFVNEGDKVRINTETGLYVERA